MNEKISKLLTEYFISENNIDMSKDYEIISIPANTLICASRFDLMAKWIYIDAREKGIDMTIATQVYKDNINSFSCGTYFEPGMTEKDSFQKYLNDFDVIIDDIKENGFDDTISLIPVGKDNRIFDGSHRVSAAAYYNKNVTIIRFPDKTPNYDYNYRYFRNYIMSDINMGYMAKQYAYLKDDCFFVCIWPVADKKILPVVEELLEKIVEIVYSQDVYLNYEGMRNLMIQIYGKQDWVGNIDDKFDGVKYKAKPCFRENELLKTYLIESKSFEEVVNIKNQIREIFGIGNHSIHISDDKEETREMAELLYNPNSVNFMNYASPYEFSLVFEKLKIFKRMINDNDLKREKFIIDSSSILEVCGLRAARDLDFLTDYIYEHDYSKEALNIFPDIDSHENQLIYHSISIKDMLYNPQNYFYYQGMKFLSVERLMEMKQFRNEVKDVIDVKLCKEFIGKYSQTPKKFRYDIIDKIHKYQLEHRDYGHGPLSYSEYKRCIIKDKFIWISKLIAICKIIKNKILALISADNNKINQKMDK